MPISDSKLFAENKRLKRTADKLLNNSGLSKILNKFGKVTFHGGYAANLLMNGDIDIYVVGKSFTKKNVLKIFNTIVKSTTFNLYQLADYKIFTHKRGIFPDSYYVGLKTRVKGEKWKFDIWFLTRRDLQKIPYHHLDKNKITPQQKLTILKLKVWRNQHSQKISGYHIYDAVLDHGIKTPNQFKKFLAKYYPVVLRKASLNL